MWRWYGRDDTDNIGPPGPPKLIDMTLATKLKKSICKVRLHSADKLCADVINPKTG